MSRSQADIRSQQTMITSNSYAPQCQLLHHQTKAVIEAPPRGQSARPKIPLGTFSFSRGILKKYILCRHKIANPPEGLKPCMPCRGKTYKIPLAFFSIYTPAGFNLVENSGGETLSIPFEGLFFFGCRGVLELFSLRSVLENISLDKLFATIPPKGFSLNYRHRKWMPEIPLLYI